MSALTQPRRCLDVTLVRDAHLDRGVNFKLKAANSGMPFYGYPSNVQLSTGILLGGLLILRILRTWKLGGDGGWSDRAG